MFELFFFFFFFYAGMAAGGKAHADGRLQRPGCQLSGFTFDCRICSARQTSRSGKALGRPH